MLWWDDATTHVCNLPIPIIPTPFVPTLLIPTQALAFKTTDGHWIQNLGVDTATHLPKLLAAVKWSKVRIAMGAPRALLTAAWRKACGGHNLEAIRAVTEMVNGIILEMMEAMTLQEFQQ
jgi:hypothetical protein